LKLNNKIIITFMILTIIIISGCTKSEIKKEPTEVTLQFKWVHATQFAGFYAASEKGFYETNGLNVIFKENNPTLLLDPIEAVVNGDADFAVAEGSSVIEAIANGKEIIAIGTDYKITPVIIFSLKEKGITEPKHLLGKTLKTSPTTHIPYQIMMKKLGLDSNEVVEVPKSSGRTEGANFIDDIIDGTFDSSEGYIVNQPLRMKRQGHDVNIIKPSDYGVRSYSDVIITKKSTLNENRELVKKFLDASVKGWEYSVQFPEEVAIITANKYKKDGSDESILHETELLKESIRLILGGDKKFLSMDENIWKTMINDLVEIKIIDSTIEQNKIYDQSLLDEIYDE